MREATLITARFERVSVQPAQDYYETRHINFDETPARMCGESEVVTPINDRAFETTVRHPIKKFCVEEMPSGIGVPPEHRNVKEWLIAMDPCIQECFDAELNTLRQEIDQQRFLRQKEAERAAFLESELDRIRDMTAWETVKVAWAKLWDK